MQAGSVVARMRTGSAGRGVSAATPGSTLPSSSSRLAPPPVLMWLMPAAQPAFSTAATLSPPPTTVVVPCMRWHDRMSSAHAA